MSEKAQKTVREEEPITPSAATRDVDRTDPVTEGGGDGGKPDPKTDGIRCDEGPS
jgi:hypothetical protein